MAASVAYVGGQLQYGMNFYWGQGYRQALWVPGVTINGCLQRELSWYLLRILITVYFVSVFVERCYIRAVEFSILSKASNYIYGFFLGDFPGHVGYPSFCRSIGVIFLIIR